jgi:hypothetical protein
LFRVFGEDIQKQVDLELRAYAWLDSGGLECSGRACAWARCLIVAPLLLDFLSGTEMRLLLEDIEPRGVGVEIREVLWIPVLC